MTVSMTMTAADKAAVDPLTYHHRKSSSRDATPRLSPLEIRYEKEKLKRKQYVNGIKDYAGLRAANIEQLSVEDPWMEEGTPVNRPVPDNGRCKVVVFGAGLSGLIFAIQCLRTGAAQSPEDILIVDPAGGFGGTWWSTRYPGLKCDVESYQYLPFLEETGYIPKRRYAHGEEIRDYLSHVATHFGLHDRAMFQSRGTKAVWNQDHWECQIVSKPKSGRDATINISSDFMILAFGPLADPKVPALIGVERFQGQTMHTARWRYEVTGGTPAEPKMDKLAGKRVAIIGNSATGAQIIPELAKHAGELYVVQRTPIHVEWRLNKNTDPVEWKKEIAAQKGWQQARSENTQAWVESPQVIPERIVVGDGWTNFPSLAALFGSSRDLGPDELPQYHDYLRALDQTWTDRIRQRVADTVKDPVTAEGLQAWYPGFCKIPVFHDEYLSSYNRPNVHLVNTDGKGVQSITTHGFVANGQEQPVDVIIWATGYETAAVYSPAAMGQMEVIGRESQTMDQVFKDGKLLTLHGLMPRQFPNLFLPGLAQAGTSINFSLRLVEQGAQVGYIINKASEKVGDGSRPVVEPTAEACDQWAAECAANGSRLIGHTNCTPSHYNRYGDSMKATPEQKKKAARFARWGRGYLDYADRLRRWRESNELEGLDVRGI